MVEERGSPQETWKEGERSYGWTLIGSGVSLGLEGRVSLWFD